MSRVVHLKPSHKHKAEGMTMDVQYIGNTRIIWDWSISETMTSEDIKKQLDALSEAYWSIEDELDQRRSMGEAV